MQILRDKNSGDLEMKRKDLSMLNKRISRKDFLRTAAALLLGAGGWRLGKIFFQNLSAKKTNSGLREARYYKQADKLAG